MAETLKYICECCGRELTEWPALTYSSPSNYNTLSEDDKKSIGDLNTDFCIIIHPEQTDRFIRCVLMQKVIDDCRYLEYGLWVSLSEKSFQDYSENFKNNHHETTYFGWLSNHLPDYDFAESIPTTVYTKTGNQRPEIVPHESFDHPFVRDYYAGITKTEAERRISSMIESTGKQQKAKPRWKFW